MLLAEATGWDRAQLAADPEAGVPAGAARRFGEMVRRRLRREPVAYILGRKGFRRIELAVDRRVLIPRPETELLVELALELEPATVLDVGTGSGAIALAVADELPGCAVTATDTSAAALEVARANAERLGPRGAGPLRQGSVPGGEAFDLILANLPYVAERDWPSLQPEITEWEPREALLAGPDGLDASSLPTGRSPVIAFGEGERRGGRWPWRWGTGRRRRSPRCCATPASRSRDPARPRRDRADRLGGRRMSARSSRSSATGRRPRAPALEHCIAGGGVAVFPADGLYGLACDPLDAAAIERIHGIKGRDDGKPSAVLYFSPLAMRELVEGLGPRTREAVGALLPGPVTLVVANPEHRYPLACREDPERLGVRLIAGPLAGAMCPLFQTSANRSGEPAPPSLRTRSPR